MKYFKLFEIHVQPNAKHHAYRAMQQREKTEISKLQMEIYAGVGAGVEGDSKGIVAEKELLQMMLDLGK